MNETEDSKRGCRTAQLVLVLVVLLVAANLVLTLGLRRDIAKLAQTAPKRADLPCAAIPTRFVAEEPACAQRLIESMNITNVRVVANASELPGLGSPVRAMTR